MPFFRLELKAKDLLSVLQPYFKMNAVNKVNA
jgi:hypothetical protein